MIPILIDTREQKTPALVDDYKVRHKLIAKELVFQVTTLPIGDLFGNNQLIEIKWGTDIYTSLISGHLEDQFKRMRLFAIDHPGIICHLILTNCGNYFIPFNVFKMVLSLCQKYGIWIHHRDNKEDGLDTAIALIRSPPPPLDLVLPVSNSKKDPFLIRVLSQIEGVSPEFAEFAIHEEWNNLDDIIQAGLKYWVLKTTQFYHKDMSSLVDKILEAIG
jgi:hypothetical protein